MQAQESPTKRMRNQTKDGGGPPLSRGSWNSRLGGKRKDQGGGTLRDTPTDEESIREQGGPMQAADTGGNFHTEWGGV